MPYMSSIYLSIYLVLFVLQVAHKASTRACQRCRSAETRYRRPHVLPFSFISLSTVLLQVSLGRPLYLLICHQRPLIHSLQMYKSEVLVLYDCIDTEKCISQSPTELSFCPRNIVHGSFSESVYHFYDRM